MARVRSEALQVAEQVRLSITGVHPDADLGKSCYFQGCCQWGAGELQMAALVQVVIAQGLAEVSDALKARVALETMHCWIFTQIWDSPFPHVCQVLGMPAQYNAQLTASFTVRVCILQTQPLSFASCPALIHCLSAELEIAPQ